MDQHHDSQYCHEKAEDLQSERVTPHCPFTSFPPILDAAMTSIHHKHECHFVSVVHKRIHLTSTSFLQYIYKNYTKSPKYY